MSYNHFEQLLRIGQVPDGACVAAALDAVSKNHDISVKLYNLAAQTYHKQQIEYSAWDTYALLGRAVGVNDEAS